MTGQTERRKLGDGAGTERCIAMMRRARGETFRVNRLGDGRVMNGLERVQKGTGWVEPPFAGIPLCKPYPWVLLEMTDESRHDERPRARTIGA